MESIVVLIDVYNQFGGASVVAVDAGRYYKNKFKNVFIVCNNKLEGEELPEDVTIIDNPTDIQKFIIEKDINLIHYFKSQHSIKHKSLFCKFVKALKGVRKEIKVLTTVCQQPSSPVAVFTPIEIKYSDYIIFIDKTAYKDPNYSFIPEYRKEWMYLSSSSRNSPYDKYIKHEYKNNSDTVVFGRGSTLNKVPKDTIDVYDKIRTKYAKEFHIIGVPPEKNWLSDAIEGRIDITTCPIVPMDKYAEKSSKFDIFLYYLPEDSYSSIDGSLGLVMRLGVPVILYGPLAPKERIEQGVNGFIAKTKEEFIEYASILADDPDLREKMGRAARQSILNSTPTIDWKDRHVIIIEKLLKTPKNEPIKIPARLYFSTYYKQVTHFIKSAVVKTFLKIYNNSI